MIWFACKKCGKTHGRTDSSAGTMVFCECGHGNTVPWESTAPEPPPAPVVIPQQQTPKGPDLEPIQFDPVTVNGPPTSTPSRPDRSDTYGTSPPPVDDEERSYRRGRTERRDPDFCFNHQRRAKEGVCAECEEAFCANCLLTFQGVRLCSACKNFRARRQELPPATSTMASASLVISLIAGPIMMCLLISSPSRAMYILSLLSLLPQVMAFGLGTWALRDAEKENKGGGQWVALSGVGTSALTCVMMLLLQLYASKTS